VLCPNQVPAEIEQIGYSSMHTQESLCLPNRFKLAHTPFPYPGRLMRLLCPVILSLFGTVDSLGNELPMGNAIAAQLIRNDLPGFTAS